METHLTISATEFKAKCLHLLDQVAETGQPIEITKRGKVVARLIRPVKGLPFGFAKGEMKIVGDIMAPLDVKWNALEDVEDLVAEEKRPYGG